MQISQLVEANQQREAQITQLTEENRDQAAQLTQLSALYLQANADIGSQGSRITDLENENRRLTTELQEIKNTLPRIKGLQIVLIINYFYYLYDFLIFVLVCEFKQVVTVMMTMMMMMRKRRRRMTIMMMTMTVVMI